VIPWLIFGVIAILVLVLGFGVLRSRRQAEHPAGETDADRARNEEEFEAAERYQELWRGEHRKEHDDTQIP
jgi:hypothetical protein